MCYNKKCNLIYGEMSEWPKVPASKTGERVIPFRGFKSLSLRQYEDSSKIARAFLAWYFVRKGYFEVRLTTK